LGPPAPRPRSSARPNERGEQQPEVAGARDDPQLLAQAPRSGLDDADRRLPGAAVDRHHAEEDHTGHHQTHDPVAVTTPDLVADQRRRGPGHHDREGEDRDRQVIRRVRSS